VDIFRKTNITRNHSPHTWLYYYIYTYRLLTLPSHTRARHKTTNGGRLESTKIDTVHVRLMESIVLRFGHLAELCEVLKREGLPPNEVRISFCCLLVTIMIQIIHLN
jgi:hypothetical protein